MTLPSSPPRAFDFGSLGTTFDPIPDALAERIAQVHYRLGGTLKRLETEKDDTFRLRTPDGRQFILKIANPGESVAELDLQVRVLQHLEQVAPDLPVPRVFVDKDGNALPELGSGRRVRLLSFLPGTVLDTLTPSPAEVFQIGQYLARMRHALASFSHPAATRALAWDVRHLPGLEPLLAHVDDPAQRRALEQGLARFDALMPRIAALRRQVLHNDFNRSNLLVDRSGPARVCGIIDFGDTVETAIAIDLATAMLNQLPRNAAQNPVPDLLESPKRLLAGYREIADLTDEELALVPHLIMGRVVARALLSLWRARLFPDNRRYILRNTEQGWAQLDWFLARSPDDMSALLL